MYIIEKPSFSPVAWNGKVPSLHKSGHGSASAFQGLYQERVVLRKLSGSFQGQGSLNPEKSAVHHQRTRRDKSGRNEGGLRRVKDTR